MRMICMFSILTLAAACTSSKGGDDTASGDIDTDTDTDTDTDEPDPLDVDDDGDGQTENEGDCDDTNPDIYTGADETCDGVDNNCSGDELDASDISTWYADADADTYGDSSDADGDGVADNTVNACEQPSGYVADSTDCDDTTETINPGAEETCDGTDNNCSGDELDASDISTWYADADQDTYGDSADADGDGVADNMVTSCDQPSGYVANMDDCNDNEALAWTGKEEVCDDVDNNCDGDIDSDATDRAAWYADADEDTYGDATDADGDGVADNMIMSCDQPSGYVANMDDCNDSEALAWTGATEICDGVDNNCIDGEADSTDLSAWYEDADGDGYGDNATETMSCDNPDTNTYPLCIDVNMTDSYADGWQGAAITIYVDGVMVDSGLPQDTLYPSQAAGTFYVDAANSSSGATENIANAFCIDLGQNLTVEVASDNYPWEVSYEFVDQDGNVVYEDDGYTVGTVLDFTLTQTHTDQGDDCDDADPNISPADNDSDGVAGCEAQTADYVGVENYVYGFSTSPDVYDCDILWTVESTGASSLCPTCEFEYDLAFTYEAVASIDTGICGSGDYTFAYGYDEDYLGYGPAIILDGYPWMSEADGATISFDGQNFSYSGGDLNVPYYSYYSYETYYETNYFSGEASVGAGNNIVADCDDTDAETYPGAAYEDSATLCLTDVDDDGFSSQFTDCDDDDGFTYPGAAFNESTEECLTDVDGDGYSPILSDECFTLEMNDSWGDGWNGNAIAVWIDGSQSAEYTISSGSYGTEEFCVAIGSELMLQFIKGSFTSEISGAIYSADGAEVIAFEGDSTTLEVNGVYYADEAVFYTSDVVSTADYGVDCDDTQDYTYPGAAYYESTTECLTDFDGDGYAANDVTEYCWTLTLEDSYGDGWNGANLALNGFYGNIDNFTVIDYFGGAFGATSDTVTACADVDNGPIEFVFSGGDWDDEITITITDADGNSESFTDPADGVLYDADWIGYDCDDTDSTTLECPQN